MAVIRQNKSKNKNGTLYRCNYNIQFTLPTGTIKRTIPNTKENPELVYFIANQGDSIVEQAWKYPLLKDWEKEIRQLLGFPEVRPKEWTISEGFQQMFDEKLKLKILSQHTIDTSQQYALRYLLQAVGDKPISALHRQDKIKIINTMQEAGLTAGGINNYHRTITAFFNWCVANGLLEKKPFHLEKIKQPDLNKKSWIAPEVFESICQHSTNPVHASYWRVSYILGLRKGELNPDKNDRMYGKQFHQCEADSNGNLFLEIYGKKQKWRRVPLPLFLLEDYVTILQHRIHPSTISQSFKQAAISAGYPQFHFHHTRHSAISNLLKGSKGNLFWVSKFVGHSKVETTMQYLRDEDFAWNMILENKDVLEL